MPLIIRSGRCSIAGWSIGTANAERPLCFGTSESERARRKHQSATSEFGQVTFDGARVPAENMVGEPGEGWRVAMTIVSHEREPGELGYVARYSKTVKELEHSVRADPDAFRSDQRKER